MEWEKEASTEIKKVPFFIRRRVKEIIEKRVSEKGFTKVTLSEVNSARTHFFKRLDKENSVLPEDEIKLYEVKSCRGEETYCPFMIGSAAEIVDGIGKIMEDLEFTRRRMAKAEGLILPHHKFKISISTCPNGCSQPQIKDIGILSQALPGRGEGVCNNCRLCVETCREGAIKVTPPFSSPLIKGEDRLVNGYEPVIDYSLCLNCGMCAKVCKRNALVIQKTGYKLMAGGRLGRHPQLAKEIILLCGEDDLLKNVRLLVETYLTKGNKEDKMADVL